MPKTSGTGNISSDAENENEKVAAMAGSTQAKARELLRQATERAGKINDTGFVKKERRVKGARAVLPVNERQSLQLWTASN